MDIKKSPKANLEKSKMMFIQLGLVIVLGFMFIAFEWSQSDVSDVDQFQIQEEVLEEEAIPVTRQEQVQPPPPPPPPKISEVLNIVENDVELEEELIIEDTEIDEDTEVDFVNIDTEDEEIDENVVFQIVEKMPSFPGGEAAMMKFLSDNIKYPTIAQENGIQGRVYVNFVVSKTGEISNIKVVRGVDPALDQEAIRVVKSMPKWEPGEQRGKPVNVSFMLPINFVLN
ncbi:energy transducer TonB [Saccharicrinis sp. FJH62]|uniref:energy transducer TonB n=1 Tax=Saccharicrinis sp. FJH62 TaxID=3344657 RepID=UPI0035D44582